MGVLFLFNGGFDGFEGLCRLIVAHGSCIVASGVDGVVSLALGKGVNHSIFTVRYCGPQLLILDALLQGQALHALLGHPVVLFYDDALFVGHFLS